MRIERFLQDSAARFASRTAVISGATRMSYAELEQQSSNLAGALQTHGVGRGDRVLVFMENGVQAAVAIFAIPKAGAVFSPVNPMTKAGKLGYLIDDCTPRAIITQPRFLPIVAAALGGRRDIIVLSDGGPVDRLNPVDLTSAAQQSQDAFSHHGIDSDLAMLIYTSGSTGRAKGVMMTHRNMDAASASIVSLLGGNEFDVILSVLPLSFNYGLYQLIMSVRLGATLVLERSFAFPQAVFEIMRREKVTGFPLVPTIAALILRQQSLPPGSMPDLRFITNTAATLPPEHIVKLTELFPSAKLFSMYGLTECKRCTYLPPEHLASRPKSVGIAIPNTEAYVVDAGGHSVGPGVIGELVIRGPHVMQGYWNDPAATENVLRPGRNWWEKVLHTGDLFYADDAGFLYFVGRSDDIIKTRGEKVAPKEVEAVLYGCPGVAEALVMGVEDALLGQSVTAMVVRTDPNLSEQTVIAHCSRQLEDYMVPKTVIFCANLPKTETGKVSRRTAMEQLVPNEQQRDG